MSISINKKIFGALAEWEQRDGKLPTLLETYRSLLYIELKARDNIAIPQGSISQETAQESLKQGTPLLSFESIPFDWGQVQKLLREVLRLLRPHLSLSPEAEEALGKLSEDLVNLRQASREWYRGESISSIAGAYGIPSDALASVLGAALRPYLTTAAEVLSPLVDQESWRRGYCPVCGGRADLAFLQKDDGARFLLCARCDSQWLFQRLECPYCVNTNQEKLSYFTDEAEKYRLYVCENCKSYLKAIDLRRVEGETLLPLERLLTLDLDKQGREAGYRPGYIVENEGWDGIAKPGGG